MLFALFTIWFNPSLSWLHIATCYWMQHYRWLNPFWRISWTGRENLPDRKCCIFIANHQSVADIFILYGLLRPFKWVAKEWVYRVPVVGWYLCLSRQVRVDPDSTEISIERCEYWLRRGQSLLIFPEGTRSPHGRLLEFKDGAFRLSVDEHIPVVPIVIRGSREILPKGARKLKWKANLEVKVMKPACPEDYGDNYSAMRDHLRQLMMEATDEVTIS